MYFCSSMTRMSPFEVLDAMKWVNTGLYLTLLISPGCSTSYLISIFDWMALSFFLTQSFLFAGPKIDQNSYFLCISFAGTIGWVYALYQKLNNWVSPLWCWWHRRCWWHIKDRFCFSCWHSVRNRVAIRLWARAITTQSCTKLGRSKVRFSSI